MTDGGALQKRKTGPKIVDREDVLYALEAAARAINSGIAGTPPLASKEDGTTITVMETQAQCKQRILQAIGQHLTNDKKFDAVVKESIAPHYPEQVDLPEDYMPPQGFTYDVFHTKLEHMPNAVALKLGESQVFNSAMQAYVSVIMRNVASHLKSDRKIDLSAQGQSR